jgi:hypothetical protein
MTDTTHENKQRLISSTQLIKKQLDTKKQLKLFKKIYKTIYD